MMNAILLKRDSAGGNVENKPEDNLTRSTKTDQEVIIIIAMYVGRREALNSVVESSHGEERPKMTARRDS